MSNTTADKKIILEQLQKEFPGVDEQKLSEAFDEVIDSIKTSLICGDRVELRGLFSMVVRKRASRLSRNPKTGQKVEVGERGSLYFRASKDLVKEVND